MADTLEHAHAQTYGSLETILELHDITKTFPGVKALDQVNFDIRAGEVHALLGENGAGKSTLMKILAGKHQADSGRLLLRGQEVTLHDPLDAKTKGIILIHQELSLVPELTVAENIFLGSLPTNFLKQVAWKRLQQDAEEILQQLECDFSANDTVGHLSIAKQQMVEIARALAFDPDVVIFDEPTSSLTDQEKTVLFKRIRSLQARGVAIVYISHRMDEIFELSNRITVLRDGQYRGTLYTAETNEEEVTKLMIGRFLDHYFVRSRKHFGEEILRVENLTFPSLFTDVNFTVQAGEVLGMYGLIGAGRSEVAQALFGLRQPSRGQMFLRGAPVVIANADEAVQRGIGFVPENRKEQGLILGMGGRDNISLAQIDHVQQRGLMDTKQETKLYQEYKDKLEIKITGPRQQVVNLSGGNQQKIVIAKWLSIEPTLLILDEPTRGIDVGSKSEIHKLIGDLAEQGYAIIVISSEMPEVMGVSHRILTMHEGRVTGEFDAETVTEDNLINAITGQIPDTAKPQPAQVV